MASAQAKLLADLSASGSLQLGEVRIRCASDFFELHHTADTEPAGLERFERYEDARQIAQNDEHGAFRPLKTAPNLRRGWLLRLRTLQEVHLALDYLYPAMLGVWRDHEAGCLRPVPLRETLERQTGMYAITRKITDAQAQATIADFCRSDTGCLKRILWEIAPGHPVVSLPPEKFTARSKPGELPLLCHEACNLLVAKAREVVKAARSQ